MISKTLFYILLIFTMIFFSCTEQTKEGCEKGKKNIEKLVMGIVLNKKPYKEYNYILKGLDINTGKDTTYEYGGRWFDQLGDYWDAGDTIVKKEGDLFLEIHKQNIIHISEWRCDDILIDGVSVGELGHIKKYGK